MSFNLGRAAPAVPALPLGTSYAAQLIRSGDYTVSVTQAPIRTDLIPASRAKARALRLAAGPSDDTYAAGKYAIDRSVADFVSTPQIREQNVNLHDDATPMLLGFVTVVTAGLGAAALGGAAASADTVAASGGTAASSAAPTVTSAASTSAPFWAETSGAGLTDLPLAAAPAPAAATTLASAFGATTATTVLDAAKAAQTVAGAVATVSKALSSSGGAAASAPPAAAPRPGQPQYVGAAPNALRATVAPGVPISGGGTPQSGALSSGALTTVATGIAAAVVVVAIAGLLMK